MPRPSLWISIPVALAAVAIAHAPAQAQRSAAPPPGFDAYVGQVLKAFSVPGAAVAIVKDGRVVLAKGYGVRRLGDSTPVDAQTRFGIASNTKLFTATALAMRGRPRRTTGRRSPGGSGTSSPRPRSAPPSPTTTSSISSPAR